MMREIYYRPQLQVLPREIAAELPSTPRLNAIMDRSMAKVKALLYELEMDRGKKPEGKKQRKKEGRKEGRKEEGEGRGMKRRGRKEDKTKTGSAAASKSYSFVFLPPSLASRVSRRAEVPTHHLRTRTHAATAGAVTQFPFVMQFERARDARVSARARALAP